MELPYGSLKFGKCIIDIVHPYFTSEDNSHLSTIIKCEYEGELFNEIPHGLGYIKYSHKEEDDEGSKEAEPEEHS